MPLRYVSHKHYARSISAAFPSATVLYFDPRLELSVEPLPDRLRELGDEIRGADLIVIRGSTRDFHSQVCETPLLREVVGRVPTATFAPRWDPDDSEPMLRPVPWAEGFAGPYPKTAALRSLELLTFLREGGAIFEQPGCHYELPSLVHASAFIRLADCLCDAIDMVRVVDWLLPSMSEGCGIVTDTGSLLGVLNLVSLEATERFAWSRIPVVALRHYPDFDHLTEVVRAFAVNECVSLVFVVSVNSSGGLARLVTEMPAIADLVIVCQSGKPVEGATVLCEHEVERWTVGEDNRCPDCEKKHLLVVNPESYEVRTDLDSQPERLDTKSAEDLSKFWEAADESDAVSLHIERDIPVGEGEQVRSTRHMAVYLDIKRLLGHKWFREHAMARLKKAGAADLVVIPRHAATTELAQLAADTFPELSADAVVEFEGASFTGDQAETVAAAKRVLVLDDALITGSTLFRVQGALYELMQQLGREIDFAAFVVVSRPSTPAGEKAVKRRYGKRAEKGDGKPDFPFSAAVSIVLPADRDCPFCRERDFLERRRIRVKSPELAARLDHLASSKDGLGEPVLLGGSGAGPTVGSLFGKLQPKAAFAAAASVAQTQKWSFTQKRPANTVKVLDTTLVVEAFYDPALAAGVLRLFDQRDLRNPQADQEFNRSIESRGSVMKRGAITEIAWSAAMRKLPLEGIRRVIKERSDADPRGLMSELLSLD